MGTNIKDLTYPTEISLDVLRNKTLVVDSFNLFFQFLTSIRGRDGAPLTDSSGKVTSVLQGLQSRIPKILSYNIKLIFVADGTPPVLKSQEKARRRAIKETAQAQYEKARLSGDEEGMKKFASMSSHLTTEIIEEALILLDAYGCPIIYAPSEGEAQASFMCSKGDAYAVVSQDFDSLIHGAPRIVRNLNLSGKRKLPGKRAFTTISPELLTLSDVLNRNGIDLDQLIALSMLVGTDYNYGGIKGLGAKKALLAVRQHGKNFDALFETVQWNSSFPVSWQEVFSTIKHMPVSSDYSLVWKPVNIPAIIDLLCVKHDFLKERVESQLAPFQKKQHTLGDFA